MSSDATTGESKRKIVIENDESTEDIPTKVNIQYLCNTKVVN